MLCVNRNRLTWSKSNLVLVYFQVFHAFSGAVLQLRMRVFVDILRFVHSQFSFILITVPRFWSEMRHNWMQLSLGLLHDLEILLLAITRTLSVRLQSLKRYWQKNTNHINHLNHANGVFRTGLQHHQSQWSRLWCKCTANLPLAVGGAAAGSMVDEPTVSVGSEAEVLPASAWEAVWTGAPAWLCICQKRPTSVLHSISGRQRVFLSIKVDFFFQHVIYLHNKTEFDLLNDAISLLLMWGSCLTILTLGVSFYVKDNLFILQCWNAYLLNSVNSSHQFISRYRASDDLQRNPIITNEESGGYTHHRVFNQGGLRN